MRINSRERKRVNKALYEVGKSYHESIPLGQIRAILKLGAGLDIMQEDGTPWSGILCGDDATTNFPLGTFPKLGEEREYIINSQLIMSWHKMQSGRYEIVAYLS
jgi:hypothetical protein